MNKRTGLRLFFTLDVHKHEGFTLVELLVSMVILAAIVLPTCTSLVLSYRMNAKTDELMQAQLAVSSTVETLMARGITDGFVDSLTQVGAGDEADKYYTSTEFPGLRFQLEQGENEPYFSVIVMDEAGQVIVETHIRDNATKTLEEVADHEKT